MHKVLPNYLCCALVLGVLGVAGARAWADEAESVSATQQLARGAKAWSDNCGQCHNTRDPGDQSDQQWDVVVAHMRIRANLTGEEARDILTFLQASN